MAKLEIPENVYNWLVDLFHGRAHCTQYNGVVSTLHEITASLIQGLSIGPSSYVVNAADLKAVTKGRDDEVRGRQVILSFRQTTLIHVI
jgi:hypothetical protein